MGKASRRKRHEAAQDGTSKRNRRQEEVPFVRRPFEGIAGETDIVAIREIVPAATATLTLTDGGSVVLATVLPLAWPGVHREDGTILIGAQSSGASGDASRDLAGQLLATQALDPGTPLEHTPRVSAETPRLQDLIEVDAPLGTTIHEGFDFWVEDRALNEEEQASMERANESAAPTVALEGLTSAYWTDLGERHFIRYVLPDDEDDATVALARLWAASAAGLGGDSRLLGAFRAGGLLVPVFEVDATADAESFSEPMLQWTQRYREALDNDAPLTPDERRAKSGVLSRQLTLR